MVVGVDVLLYPIGLKVLAELLLLILLLLGSAMISASEVAFFSLKPSDIKLLEEKATKQSLMALSLLKKPEQLLANILIANNFINISIVVLSTIITRGSIDFSGSPLLGFLIQVIIITFLILLIGEIIPKVFATDHRISVALFMAYQLNILAKFSVPLTYLLTRSTSFIQKRLALKGHNFSIDDLSDAIEITSDSLSEERNILEGIVKFGNTDASEVMQSRLDIAAIEYDAPFGKLLSLIIETSYSRIPVYEDTLDNIKGIIYTKDLLPYLHEPANFKWSGLVKQAYFVPETKKIDDLLAEFQKNKIHLAIVIDEYGGTCGLVTMEDILEEVVGEISDESDVDEELPYKKLSNNVYLFEAKILLNDFFKITGIDDTVFDEIKGEYETLAGLVLELKGEIPQKNDKIDYKNFTFIIEAVDKRRIKQIKVIFKEF
jgi:gliding motility-associated protein GldE